MLVCFRERLQIPGEHRWLPQFYAAKCLTDFLVPFITKNHRRSFRPPSADRINAILFFLLVLHEVTMSCDQVVTLPFQRLLGRKVSKKVTNTFLASVAIAYILHLFLEGYFTGYIFMRFLTASTLSRSLRGE